MAKNMAVFIDADNLNNATALDHVFADLQSRAERISYRRAYGRPESLKTIDAVLWKHGVRPVSNLVTNKVTTDIALTIDVVEAVCRRGIDAVVICSGDADFVPLATWLREQGCFVLCFSLNNTLFANPESFYDDVVMLEVVEKPVPLTEPAPHAVLALSPAPAALWAALRARDRQRLFIELRPLWAEARLLLFGHALLEKLVSPRKPMVAHVYQAPQAIKSIAALDDWLAQAMQPQPWDTKPFAPLPVLGVPGWWPGNEAPEFYADAQVFRPPR